MLAALTGNRTWGDFGISAEEMRERLDAVHSGDAAAAVRAFFDAYAERQGKPRWGDKTPAYMLSVQRIGRTLPESRFIHLIRDGRDVALSQSARAINEQPPPGRAGRALGQADPQVARAGGDAEGRRATSRPATRTSSAIPRRRCAGSASSSTCPGTPAMLSYHERAAERLTEMAGELRAEGSHATQEAGYRIDNHAPTTRPPDPSKLDKWRTRDDARGRRRLRGRRRRVLELGYEVTS